MRQCVAVLAHDREQCREIVQNVSRTFCDSRKENVIKQREMRKKAKAKREERK
jgi:hypothetical protein